MLTTRPFRGSIFGLLDLETAQRTLAADPSQPDGAAKADSRPESAQPAGDQALERALGRVIEAAERACEALGWLGWEARHAAERELRAALEEIKRLRNRGT